MFRSCRGRFSALGLIAGLVFAIIFASFLIGWGNLKSAEYERHSDTNSRHYSEYTRKKIAETCVAISPIEKAKCVYEAHDKEQEYKYNQTDLVAQRQSALWAYVMGLAAVIGMALSALGVWLVKTTFDETRKANEITKSQQRARIIANIEVFPNKDHEILNIVISAKNIGHSAAFNCVAGTTMLEKLPDFYNFSANPGVPRDIASSESEQMIVCYGENTKILGIYVCGKIEYHSIFGSRHSSYFCARIIPSDLTKSGYVAMDDYPANWPKNT